MDCLRQSVRSERSSGNEAAWVFLAFAHLKTGQKAEARKWLDQVPAPLADASFSWGALELELLRPIVAEIQKEISAPGK
jgi:hypothetical protein